MPMKLKPKKRAVKKLNNPDLVFSYKDLNSLTRFMNELGMIISRIETGLSQKQQRMLGREVKRARHLALLPFTQTL